MKKVWFAALMLVYLDLSIRVGTAPLCPYGQAGCHVPSLADLFERVIQQSSRMHGISSDLHAEFEQYFFPSKNMIGKRKCHTYGILTPDDKENAQRLGLHVSMRGTVMRARDAILTCLLEALVNEHGDKIRPDGVTVGAVVETSEERLTDLREQLTEVILRLLEAWGDPLSQLYQTMAQDQNQDFNHYSSEKALELSDMVNELRDGVTKMADKMKLLGVLGNTVGYISPESLLPSPAFSFYKRGDLNSMDHHDLLYCFRRDSNKVKNYLRILKCTTLPGLDC